MAITIRDRNLRNEQRKPRKRFPGANVYELWVTLVPQTLGAAAPRDLDIINSDFN